MKKPGKKPASKGPNRPAKTNRSGFSELVGRKVILDTAGPITFLGTLVEERPDGLWLEQADIRDRNEGHVSKERYACEAKLSGIRANRQRIFVAMSVIISASALDDVVVDFPGDTA
jgi:hypothetical protein